MNKSSLSAWQERRGMRSESDRRIIAERASAHLPQVSPITISDEDIAALKAAFIRRFDEDAPRTETLFAVMQIGRRIEAREREQAA